MRAGRDNAFGAARATASIAWFAAVVICALAVDHPMSLVALAIALMAAGVLVGAGHILLKALAFSLPLALTVLVVNALVSKDGVTVVARLGELPVIGRFDLTLEALAQSGVLALRVVTIGLAAALFAACIDQDELVGLIRRRGGRVGIVTALAARMVPLLAADGRRMSEARRAMPAGVAPSRTATFAVLAGGALDRAADAAATLELRGLGESPCLAPRGRRPASRHDIALLVSAAAMLASVAAALASGWLDCTFGTRVQIEFGPGTVLFAAVLPLVAVLPLLERRGVAR